MQNQTKVKTLAYTRLQITKACKIALVHRLPRLDLSARTALAVETSWGIRRILRGKHQDLMQRPPGSRRRESYVTVCSVEADPLSVPDSFGGVLHAYDRR